MKRQVVLFFQKYSFFLLLIWIVILAILYSLLSVIRHNTFQSGAFDLGIFDQAVWQYAHFLFPYNTIKERFILGDHLTLTLPLLAPLFWIWNDVRTLLIFQVVWIAVSTIPIYLLAKLRNLSAFSSLLLSIIYSLFFGIQYGVFFDFHPIIIGVGLLVWTAYFFEAKKKKLFITFLLLTLLTQENMGIAFACLGCVYLFYKKYRRSAILFIIGGIIASFICIKIIGYFYPVGYEYFPNIPHNPIEIAKGYFATNERRQVWLYSLSWFSFLPIFSPGAMLAEFGDLFQYFILGGSFSWMQGPFLHHRAILAFFLILGTFDVLFFLKKRKINVEIIVIILFIISIGLQFYFHFPLNKLAKKVYWQHESWMDNDNALFAFLPKNASVASAQNLVPHISHRKEVYLLYPRKHKVPNTQCAKMECWWLDFAGKPTYILVDLHPNQWVTQLLESNQNFSQAVSNMENAKKISLVKQIRDARLYKVIY